MKWKLVLLVIISILMFRLIFEIFFLEKSKPKSPKIFVKTVFNERFVTKIIDNYVKPKRFKILLWNKFYSINWYIKKDKYNKGKYLEKCPNTDCILSNNRDNLSSYDAILFHWFNIDPDDLPQQVYDHQKWVMYTVEPPTNTHIGLNYTGLKKVDWVMSYRTDSDIIVGYGRVYKCKKKWKQKYSFKGKTKSIAWFVSHCNTTSNRDKYAEILSKYIGVDIYGECGPFKCDKTNRNCVEMIAKDYKFYLSFENSLCKDYVTEKTFQYMNYDIIPVVMGSANYSKLLPYNSYIDVFNFSSPQHLAHYLNVVGSDERLYNSYFEWKNNHCIEGATDFARPCRLCKYIEKSNHQSSFTSIGEFRKWWITGSDCKTIVFKNDTFELVNSCTEPGLSKPFGKMVWT